MPARWGQRRIVLKVERLRACKKKKKKASSRILNLLPWSQCAAVGRQARPLTAVMDWKHLLISKNTQCQQQGYGASHLFKARSAQSATISTFQPRWRNFIWNSTVGIGVWTWVSFEQIKEKVQQNWALRFHLTVFGGFLPLSLSNKALTDFSQLICRREKWSIGLFELNWI